MSASALKRKLRSSARSSFFYQLINTFLIIYVLFFGTILIQEGFPILTQLVMHAQCLKWGALWVKGWGNKYHFIFDWREAAYDTQSLRGNGWNIPTWIGTARTEREIVLSCFALILGSVSCCFTCIIICILQLYPIVKKNKRILRPNKWSRLAATSTAQTICLLFTLIIYTYLCISGLRSLVDQPGSHVYFGPGFLILIIAFFLSALSSVQLHSGSKNLSKVFLRAEKIAELRRKRKNTNTNSSRSRSRSRGANGSTALRESEYYSEGYTDGYVTSEKDYDEEEEESN